MDEHDNEGKQAEDHEDDLRGVQAPFLNNNKMDVDNNILANKTILISNSRMLFMGNCKLRAFLMPCIPISPLPLPSPRFFTLLQKDMEWGGAVVAGEVQWWAG